MTDQLENLRQYNIWRRGDSDDMPHPVAIGETIDWAIAEIERLRKTVTTCYQMLLSEPDTQGALCKAENMLRESLVEGKK